MLVSSNPSYACSWKIILFYFLWNQNHLEYKPYYKNHFHYLHICMSNIYGVYRTLVDFSFYLMGFLLIFELANQHVQGIGLKTYLILRIVNSIKSDSHRDRHRWTLHHSSKKIQQTFIRKFSKIFCLCQSIGPQIN